MAPREALDSVEASPGHPLEDELGNALAPMDLEGVNGIQVDHDDLDLTPVTRIDRPRCVDQAEPETGSESTARMHEAHRPSGEPNGYLPVGRT